ncbi:tetraacyldisaccharide 4'-kinase [Ramlibacter sp.]|uniref:tetraacyldisaccharide 4'-kinase n=1 Tax=Ramlibacter sp. TaxID=1917967 RepID=UPI0018477ECA|nr:tetraacyldisaccharide 4'-kinase [Ramlibacter sp.]MBA2675148.1 tetraacyldisaccharide 4'-kinase [Ramlibacter sp.]
MREALQRAWLDRGALAWLLRPISLVFGALAAARRGLYRAGALRSTRLPIPVIVVGNVLAGGAGKTPVVIALLEHLQAQGLRAGLVSRGYGRAGDDCREVAADGDPHAVGDEPLLVKQRTGAPVFVAPRRAEAALALLRAYPATQVIVSDDGLQHYALARDIEICVFDERGAGNGWLLPAGPLREPWPRPVDLVLRPQQATGIQGFTVRRTLSDYALRADGTRTPLSALRTQPLRAVAGIARPAAFFAMLRERGLHPSSCTALPDHAEFDAGDFADATPLVCTQKDAVKLWRLRSDAWAVPLQLDIEPAFWDALDRLLHAKLSSRHGSQTA